MTFDQWFPAVAVILLTAAVTYLGVISWVHLLRGDFHRSRREEER
jgi:hypothetical protein